MARKVMVRNRNFANCPQRFSLRTAGERKSVGQPTNPDSPGKWSLIWLVCMCEIVSV